MGATYHIHMCNRAARYILYYGVRRGSRINPDETTVVCSLQGSGERCSETRQVGDDFRCNEVGPIYFGVFGIYGVLTLFREVIMTGKRLQVDLVLT